MFRWGFDCSGHSDKKDLEKIPKNLLMDVKKITPLDKRDKRDHLGDNYEAQMFHKRLAEIYTGLSQFIKNNEFPKNSLVTFSWLKAQDFSLEINDFIKLVLGHYNPQVKEEITNYRIMRTFFRIVKNMFRGLYCTNVTDFFDV